MSKEIDESTILSEFEKILNDEGVPKNIKIKISTIVSMFSETESTTKFKTNKALQELDEISEETNIPEHVRTQIWSIVSILESLE
tara:strand:- start:195 stop:449 length:255 start_codon:yes stop_codon:yes gene_type:complete